MGAWPTCWWPYRFQCTGVCDAAHLWEASPSTYLALPSIRSLSIPVLRSFLAIGLLKFGGSYNMARDITWGAAQFIVALALFEYFAAKIKAQNSGTRH